MNSTRKDLTKPDGTDYTDVEILSYFDQRYHQTSDGGYWIRSKRVTAHTILRSCGTRSCGKSPSHCYRRCARRQTPPPEREEWRYGTLAGEMMRAMGWKGGGIGRHENGRIEPVSAGKPLTPRAGLGYQPKASAAAPGKPEGSRPLGRRPTGKGMRVSKPEADRLRAVVEAGGEIVYGYPAKHARLEIAKITIKGIARRTGELLEIDPSHLEEVARWGKRVMGRAPDTFPQPDEWRFEGTDVALDKLNVKTLTRTWSTSASCSPACARSRRIRRGSSPTVRVRATCLTTRSIMTK